MRIFGQFGTLKLAIHVVALAPAMVVMISKDSNHEPLPAYLHVVKVFEDITAYSTCRG